MKLKQITFYMVVASCFGLSFGLTSLVKKTDKEGFAKTLTELQESYVQKKEQLFKTESESSSSSELAATPAAPQSLKEAVAELNNSNSKKDCAQGKCNVGKKNSKSSAKDQKMNLGSLKVDQETASSDPKATAKLNDIFTENENEHGGITQKIDSKSFEKSAN